jgi:hypothetical protein
VPCRQTKGAYAPVRIVKMGILTARQRYRVSAGVLQHLDHWRFIPQGDLPCGGNVGMPEPFLHLGDVCLVVERIGGGRGPE